MLFLLASLLYGRPLSADELLIVVLGGAVFVVAFMFFWGWLLVRRA